jgi:hypothetical protein
MDKDDEYRKQAAETQTWADRTINAADKKAWLAHRTELAGIDPQAGAD